MTVTLFVLLLGLVHSHPDEGMSMTQYIKKHGYPIETHHMVTPDGYILAAQRMPHGRSGTSPDKVVLLVHGMGGSAENYIFLGPPDALAFYLADRGYDVWFFNARGTVHSRRHRTLHPLMNAKSFWNFSWHEIGIYDLPTTINYVLNHTAASSLFYVGHSQGGTTYYVMMSERPEMNEKVRAAALMAPASFLQHTQSALIKFLSRIHLLLKRLLDTFNWYELVTPNSPMLNSILVSLCKPPVMQDFCMDLLYLIGGTENGLVNKTLLPIILQWGPSALSVLQIMHYGQIVLSGGFLKFDHGPLMNRRLYNSSRPPSYNLSNVRAPLAYFYAVEDPFSNVKMAEELFEHVPNVVLKYQIPINGWNHIDFILANNAKEVINDKILEVFTNY